MAYSPSASTFPSAKTSLTSPTASDDSSIFDLAGFLTALVSCITELEDTVGVTSSTDTASVNYKLTNASQSNPGHKHTLAQGATDVTASKDELNVLDGIPATLTATELGYVDGVTSAIQTQLNNHDHNGGDGGAIVEAAITLADNTTNNVTTSKHGFVPKAPNNTTTFLRGDATWAAPAATGIACYQVTPTSAQTTTNTSFEDMASGTQSVVIGATSNVYVFAHANVANGTALAYTYIQLTYDAGAGDTVIGTEGHSISHAIDEEHEISTGGLVLSLAAGTYTFALMKRVSAGTGTYHNPTMSIMVFPA